MIIWRVQASSLWLLIKFCITTNLIWHSQFLTGRDNSHSIAKIISGVGNAHSRAANLSWVKSAWLTLIDWGRSKKLCYTILVSSDVQTTCVSRTPQRKNHERWVKPDLLELCMLNPKRLKEAVRNDTWRVKKLTHVAIVICPGTIQNNLHVKSHLVQAPSDFISSQQWILDFRVSA